MADRPFDTQLWARPGIPMREDNPRPRRWYHIAVAAGVVFYLGFLLGSCS